MTSIQRWVALAFDARSRAQIEGEVRAEVSFHLESAIAELVRDGLDPRRARREAIERFGDVDDVVSLCVEEQLRGKTAMQRVSTITILFLGAAVLLMGAGLVWMQRRVQEARTETHHARLLAAERLQALQAGRRDARSFGLTTFTDTDGDGFPDARVPDPDGEPGAVRASVDPVGGGGDDAASFRAAFLEDPLDPRRGRETARRLAQLPPDQGLEVVREVWADLSPAHRQRLLEAFAEAAHPHLLEVLDLGARAPGTAAFDAAMTLLGHLTFGEVPADPTAYAAWRARTAGLSFDDVLRAEVGAWVERLGRLGDEAFAEALGTHAPRRSPWPDAVRRAMVDGGFLPQIEARLARGGGVEVLGALADLPVDGDWLRAHVHPIASDAAASDRTRSAACAALGREGAGWAVPTIAAFVRDRIASLAAGSRPYAEGSADGPLLDAVGALVEIGDPAAIPHLIAAVRDDPTGWSIYNVGAFGLAKLTGVRYDASHDGAWWVRWWTENQRFLPQEIRGTPLPDRR